MSQYLLGIDLGTSSVKVALLSATTLKVVARAEAEYPIHHPAPGYAEQDPEQWWKATVEATRKTLNNLQQPDVIAIGLSGQMHGLVCVDKTMQPVQEAIIWADGRSETQVKELVDLQEQSDSKMPGFPATGFAASSALWLKQNKPDVLKKTHQWCLPKDYLRLKLTGDLSTEPSDAASTWLFDVVQQTWAQDICEYCGLSPSQMPRLTASHEVSGQLTSAGAQALGLSSGIPVIGGSADLPAQALGYGIDDPAKMLIIVGSGGQVFLPTAQPEIIEGALHYVFNHVVPNTWYVQTSILTAGLSLRWLRDLVGLASHDNPYALLSELAETAEAGTDGLLFMPYLAGERNPDPDANAHGLIYGLKLSHQKGHIARAIMEGVGFAIKESLSHISFDAETYILAGGVANSSVWCQIMANILDHELEVSTNQRPFGCIGAGILAGVGSGHFASFADATQLLNTTEHQIFVPKHADTYHSIYEQFLKLYHSMKNGESVPV